MWDKTETAAQLMLRADQALYVAKRSGGGRVAKAGVPAEPAGPAPAVPLALSR